MKMMTDPKMIDSMMKMADPKMMDSYMKMATDPKTVSYTHLRAHETVLDIVCRLLLEKKKTENT